ncbi:hypothetical protein BJ684DRAFT_14852 [Piptocephalis cylindrospora]|uniref:CUE domain-containing protein n=1 Tax=Piptocephalis cylindrospora TaxID=1907219 RepID=A0A4P9Y6X6_9FUNG|nr:hypothetical protein BJ684DRAFT_14852 [Piptocephalis cylindrospora]|eukprot:RKP14858.1 hypothetical protein BJ684DRAFT_14852 [Piptocephalis cylindrospora]
MSQQSWTILVNATPPLPDPATFSTLVQNDRDEALRRLTYFLKVLLTSPTDALYDLFLDEGLAQEMEEAAFIFTSITRHVPRITRSGTTSNLARLVLGVYARLFQLFSTEGPSEDRSVSVGLTILHPRWLSAPHLLDIAEIHAYANGPEVSRLILQAMMEVSGLQDEWDMLGRVLTVHLQQHLSTLTPTPSPLSMAVMEALVQALGPAIFPLDALLHAESSLTPGVFSSNPKLPVHLARLYEYLALTLGPGGGERDGLGSTFSPALRNTRYLQYGILSILSTHLGSLLPSDQGTSGSGSAASSILTMSTGLPGDGLDHLCQALEAMAFPEGAPASRTMLDLNREFHLLSRLSSTISLLGHPTYQGLVGRIETSITACRDEMGYEGLCPSLPEPSLTEMDKPRKDRTEEERAIRHSNIGQVRDLLPDLGESFIDACLEHYRENVEMVIQHLLEDDLPPPLSSLDRSLSLEGSSGREEGKKKDGLVSSRQNIFDEDSFDVFSGKTLQAGQVQQGKRMDETAETMLANRDAGMKERTREDILRLVAAQEVEEEAEAAEMEEQERYWAAEGRAIALPEEGGDEVDGERTGPTMPRPVPMDPMVKHQATLIAEYTSNQGLFSKGKEVRNSKARVQLRQTTGLSDEQIEGWASMLERQAHVPDSRSLLGWPATIPGTQGWGGSRKGRKSQEGRNHSNLFLPRIRQCYPRKASTG